MGAIGLVALSMRQSVSPVLSTTDADRRSSHREPLNRTRGLEGHGAVGLVKLRPDSSRAALEQSRASVASRARFVGWTRALCEIYFTKMLGSHVCAEQGQSTIDWVQVRPDCKKRSRSRFSIFSLAFSTSAISFSPLPLSHSLVSSRSPFLLHITSHSVGAITFSKPAMPSTWIPVGQLSSSTRQRHLLRRAFVRHQALIGQPVNRKLNDSTASCMVHSLGRLYYPARKTIHGMRLVLLSSSSSQFSNCGEAAVCAEMTYMIARQLPKACIISIMHSGRLVFVFPRHLSLLHAATLLCMYTLCCCCWGVIIYTQSTFLPLPFSSFCNHKRVSHMRHYLDPLSQDLKTRSLSLSQKFFYP